MLLLRSRPNLKMLLCELGFLFSRFEKGRPSKSINVRLVLTEIVLATAASTILTQALGAAYLFRTIRAGDLKGLYHVGNLTPYWWGVEA